LHGEDIAGRDLIAGLNVDFSDQTIGPEPKFDFIAGD